jgi:hypothetical protein
VLFLIYINDLPKNNLLKNFLFADDTTLLDSDSNFDNLVQKINVEFHKVINYFKLNKMALHPEKTKFILFSNKRWTPLPNVVFNFNPIDSPHENPNLILPMLCVNRLQNPSIRFLGVLIDPQLNFKYQTASIVKKLSTAKQDALKSTDTSPQTLRMNIYKNDVHEQLLSDTTDPTNLVAQIYEKYKDYYHFVYF